MIVLYIRSKNISICEITLIKSIYNVDNNFKTYFNKYNIKEDASLYFIDANKAYEDAPNDPYCYNTINEAYESICSFIEYEYINGAFRRFEGYGRFNSSIPYHEEVRRELNDNNLELYEPGTLIEFINYNNKIEVGIILNIDADDLRTYSIYSLKYNILYDDNYEPIHNNEILKILGKDYTALKDIINNKIPYIWTEEYRNYINSL